MKTGVSIATLCGAIALLFASTAHAVAVTPFTQMFTTTSNSVNTIDLNFGTSYQLAIFDSTDLGSFSSPLVLDSGGIDTIDVTYNPNITSPTSLTLQSALNPSQILNLSGMTFFFAMSTDSGANWSPWLESLTEDSPTNWSFDFVANGVGADDLVAVDITTVGPPQEVPVPAAVWLFGSGLIGLVGMARRRK